MLLPITFYSTTAFINFLAALFFGLLVLQKARQRKENRYFAYFCFAVSFWSFFYTLWLTTSNLYLSEFYLRTCMISIFFAPSLFFHFLHHFSKKENNRWAIPLNYAFSFLAMTTTYTDLYAHNLEPFLNFLWLRPGPAFHIIVAHFCAIFIYCGILLYREYRTSYGSLKEQYKLILIGILIGVVSGSTNYLMWYRIPVPPIANALVVVYVFIFTYAVLRHHLMDIRIMVKRSLVYSVTAAAISITYVVTVQLTQTIFQATFGYNSGAASLTAGFVIALCFIPFKNFIQTIVDQFLFQASIVQIAEQNALLRQQLIHSERYRILTEVTKSIIDTLRDPLTSLKGYSYHLSGRAEDPAFVRQTADVFKRKIARIEEMVNDLAKYSVPTEKDIKPTDVHLLVHRTVERNRPTIAGLGIELRNQIPADLPVIMDIDPLQIQQAIFYVVKRSVSNMPKGGSLTVTSQLTDSHCVIEIKDSGETIPDDVLEKIFDPYFRYKEKSMEMDLSIAFSVIENHGGKIWIKTTKPAGNEFVIELPLQRPVSAS